MLSVISGPFVHHLDHLAPLSHFLDCPLLVEDPTLYKIGKKYYPNVKIYLGNFNVLEIAQEFSTLLLSTRHAGKELKSIYDSLDIKMKYVYVPHGQSDKGLEDKRFASTMDQDFVLLYGKRQSKITNSPYLIVGNYRAKYQKLYGPHLPKSKTNTILYAPSWDDGEHPPSTVHLQKLITQLPEGYDLIVKVHPLTYQYQPHLVEQISSKAHIVESPQIYPLLEITDIYLGDYSAIGYDALYFELPSFFLTDRSLPLHKAGLRISSVEEFYEKVKTPIPIDKNIYKEAFDDVDPFTIKKLLEKKLREQI